MNFCLKELGLHGRAGLKLKENVWAQQIYRTWRINNRPVVKRREKPREIRNNRLSSAMAASTKKKNDATVGNYRQLKFLNKPMESEVKLMQVTPIVICTRRRRKKDNGVIIKAKSFRSFLDR